MKAAKKIKLPAPKRPLPRAFAGAAVVDGQGMMSSEIDKLIDKHALNEFYTQKDEGVFLVVEDDALQDLDDSVSIKLFLKEDHAIRYAQSQASGNVNQRVLKVTDQTLVVATMNELPDV